DPTAKRGPLPPRQTLSPQVRGLATAAAAAGAAPARGKSAAGVVRTALCLEPRQGTLHVFMPPTETLEEYLALVAAVEDTAKELHQPVRLEGYHPPSDHRLQRLQITPDPGVLEVNIQPAASWRELVDNTTVLYQEARQLRLG